MNDKEIADLGLKIDAIDALLAAKLTTDETTKVLILDQFRNKFVVIYESYSVEDLRYEKKELTDMLTWQLQWANAILQKSKFKWFFNLYINLCITATYEYYVEFDRNIL